MEISYQYGYDDGSVKITAPGLNITVERKYSVRLLQAWNKEQRDRWLKVLEDNPDLAKII